MKKKKTTSKFYLYGAIGCIAVMPLAAPIGSNKGLAARDFIKIIVDEVDVADLCEPLQIAGPGFINIRLRNEVLAQVVTGILTDPSGVIEQADHPQRVVIDYSAPNVAKPMHVGNLRSTIIGDCFARVLRAQGHTVIAQNHIGDWGTQFGMLVEQILFEGIDADSLDLDSSVALYRRAIARQGPAGLRLELARACLAAVRYAEAEEWARQAAATTAPKSEACTSGARACRSTMTRPTAAPRERPTQLTSRLWVRRVRT